MPYTRPFGSSQFALHQPAESNSEQRQPPPRGPRRRSSYGSLTLILWPPSSIILGTIVFRALGKPNSPSHAATVAEQCGRSRLPKAMRFPPLLGHPPQKSQYRGAATPQVVYLGVTRQNVTDTHAHHHQDIAPEPCDHINTVC